MPLSNCKLIDLPKIEDYRGNLTVVEGGRHMPFDIARAYWLYDVPGGAYRACHAHKKLEQVLVAASGSCDVTLDDGRSKQRFHLNRAYFGLYICPMIWREIDNFSGSSVLLVFASRVFEPDDYIREHEKFVELANR